MENRKSTDTQNCDCHAVASRGHNNRERTVQDMGH